MPRMLVIPLLVAMMTIGAESACSLLQSLGPKTMLQTKAKRNFPRWCCKAQATRTA